MQTEKTGAEYDAEAQKNWEVVTDVYGICGFMDVDMSECTLRGFTAILEEHSCTFRNTVYFFTTIKRFQETPKGDNWIHLEENPSILEVAKMFLAFVT